MGRVSYTGITDGATRSAANMNALVTPFNTESSSLDSGNYRDEGMDTKVIADGAMTDGRDEVEFNAGLTNVVATAHPVFATLAIGASTFSMNNGGLGWTVGQNVGRVRVKFGTMWDYTANSLRHIVYFKLQYQIDAGAFQDVPYSEWSYASTQQIAYVAVNRTAWYESMAYDYDIPYPSDGASHTLNAVRVMLADSAGNTYRFNNTYFRAKRYVKAVT